MALVYKVLSQAEWEQAQQAGVFRGAAVDKRDGYIHLSTADQLRVTIRLHFAGRNGLVLLAVDDDTLGGALKWEPSRGGALFPHLYADLPLDRVSWSKPFAAADADEIEALLAPAR